MNFSKKENSPDQILYLLHFSGYHKGYDHCIDMYDVSYRDEKIVKVIDFL